MVVLNKWEGVGERRVEEVVDWLGDLEVEIVRVRSDRGRVEVGVLLGLDLSFVVGLVEGEGGNGEGEYEYDYGYWNEVEVFSVELKGM